MGSFEHLHLSDVQKKFTEPRKKNFKHIDVKENQSNHIEMLRMSHQSSTPNGIQFPLYSEKLAQIIDKKQDQHKFGQSKRQPPKSTLDMPEGDPILFANK